MSSDAGAGIQTILSHFPPFARHKLIFPIAGHACSLWDVRNQLGSNTSIFAEKLPETACILVWRSQHQQLPEQVNTYQDEAGVSSSTQGMWHLCTGQLPAWPHCSLPAPAPRLRLRKGLWGNIDGCWVPAHKRTSK